jgi:hypothetical protein
MGMFFPKDFYIDLLERSYGGHNTSAFDTLGVSDADLNSFSEWLCSPSPVGTLNKGFSFTLEDEVISRAFGADNTHCGSCSSHHGIF